MNCYLTSNAHKYFGRQQWQTWMWCLHITISQFLLEYSSQHINMFLKTRIRAYLIQVSKTRIWHLNTSISWDSKKKNMIIVLYLKNLKPWNILSFWVWLENIKCVIQEKRWRKICLHKLGLKWWLLEPPSPKQSITASLSLPHSSFQYVLRYLYIIDIYSS